MKIAIIGATGRVGKDVVREALMRGHEVVAIVRNRSKLPADLDVAVIERQILDLTPHDFIGVDAVINAFGAAQGEEHLYVDFGKHLITLLEGTNTHLITVAGAGNLFVDKEKKRRLLEEERFPKIYLQTALNQLQNLQDLRNSSVNWTFISSSEILDPSGPRTGHYIKGKDHVLYNSQLNSYVSYADFAVAVIDTAEKKEHLQERITVASENITSAS
ncbi:MAG: NAD(P)H-binding protein [Caryophanon sp.]|nr:NAD(P)H-binding protein [Caryophanon sp.]